MSGVTKFVCECGSTVQRRGASSHKKTDKHLKHLSRVHEAARNREAPHNGPTDKFIIDSLNADREAPHNGPTDKYIIDFLNADRNGEPYFMAVAYVELSNDEKRAADLFLKSGCTNRGLRGADMHRLIDESVVAPV